MPTGFGLSKALTVDTGMDQRLNDLRYHEEQMRRIGAENAAKTKLFLDDVDFQNAANSFDSPIIKKKMQETIRGIGQFVRENPDWNTNVDKALQIKMMKRSLKDNPDLIRGLASDLSYKEYLKDLQEVAKNSEQHDRDAYDDIGRQWQNYLKYGNQNGEEAAKTHGMQAFSYIKPRDFVDIAERWRDIGGKFEDMIPQDIKGAGRGAYQEIPNSNTLRGVAQQEYAQNKRQYDLQAAKQGVDPITYVMQGIEGFIPKKRYLGDYNLSDAMTMYNLKKRDEDAKMKPVGPTTWEAELEGKEAGTDNGEVFKQIFGPRPTVPVITRSGKQIALTGKDIEYTGRHSYFEIPDPKTGKKVRQKYVEVYTDMPKDISHKEGFTYDPWGFGDNKVNPDFDGMVSTFTATTKDGPKEMVRVSTWMPIDVKNASYRGRYNKLTTAAKFQQDPVEGQADYTGWTEDETGNVFNANGQYMGKATDFQ